MEWYEVSHIESVDSPAVIVYPDRLMRNIAGLIGQVNSVTKLRPHIKTHKTREIAQLMIDAGIAKFKCATIAEAEMLGMISAPDVLLAYQPVGPKVRRFTNLIQEYTTTNYSCLVDNFSAATALSVAAVHSGISLDIFIDLNTGMDRTGVKPNNALDLLKHIHKLHNLKIKGIHAYDGQIHDTDEAIRREKTVKGFQLVNEFAEEFERELGSKPIIIAGGSVTFPYYKDLDVECSPGTFIFWDWSYKHLLPDEPYEYAALLITRVISIVDKHTITMDLGHKSVASENPLPRVHFLNAPDAKPVGHSEEHLTVSVPDSSSYHIGQVLYGVPDHICPSVSMYEELSVVIGHRVVDQWKVIARDKKINI